jgi:cytochrome c oxidase subunit II
MEWIRSLMLPPQGSAYAKDVDMAYMGIFWLSVVLFLGITFAALYFAWRFRYVPGRVTPHQTHNTLLEITWSVGPLILCVGLFFWGLNGFLKFSVAPGDAMEISITAKQWLWQFEYPDGSRTINDIHVPINKPVKFVMTSEDVLHDFFVPDMRVKNDVIPGRYTEVWFQPTMLGKHTFTCAEYCGKDHSGMKGILTVESDAEFAKWMETGGTEYEDYFKGTDPTKTPEAWGKLQYERKGCVSCHTLDGSRGKGPSWKGIYGKNEKLNNGQTVLVNDDYLRESFYNPQAKVVEGFEPIMPTFQGLLRDHEAKGLIAFIRSLK